MSTKQAVRDLFRPSERAVTFLGTLLLLANIFFVLVYCKNKLHYHMPYYYEPGYQFAGFKDKLGAAATLGYLTNKDFSPGKNDGVYLQAQYFLSPAVLKLNDESQEYLILDYSDQIYLFYMIKKLKASILADNPYGQVLVRQRQQ